MKYVFTTSIIIAVAGLGASSANAQDASPLSGPYVGLNIGGGVGAGRKQSGSQSHTGLTNLGTATGVAGPTTAWQNSVSTQLGPVGGLTAGYNFRPSSLFLIGVEADFGWADVRSKGAFATTVPVGVNATVAHNGALSNEQIDDWFGTVRGRVGISPFTPDLVVYATGGLAYGSVRTTFTFTDTYLIPAVLTGTTSATSKRWGWTAGAGAEWSMNGNWSLKGEWLYVDLKDSSLSGTQDTELIGPKPFPIFRVNQNFHNDFHVFRIGLNYRF